MRRLLILGASALVFASLVPEDASAQRIRAGGIGMGGARGVAIGRPAIGGVGRVGIGGPGRWAGVGRVGIGGPGRWAGVGGPGWVGRSAAWGGPGLVGRRVAWGGWRPGWRRGFPIAAGVALAGVGAWGYYNNSYYDNSCLAWDGWQWVNVCYQPSYGYYGYGW